MSFSWVGGFVTTLDYKIYRVNLYSVRNYLLIHYNGILSYFQYFHGFLCVTSIFCTYNLRSFWRPNPQVQQEAVGSCKLRRLRRMFFSSESSVEVLLVSPLRCCQSWANRCFMAATQCSSFVFRSHGGVSAGECVGTTISMLNSWTCFSSHARIPLNARVLIWDAYACCSQCATNRSTGVCYCAYIFFLGGPRVSESVPMALYVLGAMLKQAVVAHYRMTTGRVVSSHGRVDASKSDVRWFPLLGCIFFLPPGLSKIAAALANIPLSVLYSSFAGQIYL